MPTLTQLLRPFAASIAAKLQALAELEPKLSPSQRARLRESISDDIKKCSNFVALQVSQAALERARRLGVDLYAMTWHEQTRFDWQRRVFHLEHMVPVNLIRERCKACATPDRILKVLTREIRVVWILKSEDAALRWLGFQSKRPDPDAAYMAAGIRLAARRTQRPRKKL
jgi:hypothetical protein